MVSTYAWTKKSFKKFGRLMVFFFLLFMASVWSRPLGPTLVSRVFLHIPSIWVNI